MINTLRNIFFRDFWLKLFSLVLAVLIWLIVWLFAIRKEAPPRSPLGDHSVEHVFFDVPVMVMSAAADVRAIHVNPDHVAIKVRGDFDKLQLLDAKLHNDPTAKDVRAIVDLTDTTLGGLHKIDVVVPPDVTLEQVDPDEVEVIRPSKK